MQVFNNKDKCTCGEEGVYGTLLSAQFFHKHKTSLKIKSIHIKKINTWMAFSNTDFWASSP